MRFLSNIPWKICNAILKMRHNRSKRHFSYHHTLYVYFQDEFKHVCELQADSMYHLEKAQKQLATLRNRKSQVVMVINIGNRTDAETNCLFSYLFHLNEQILKLVEEENFQIEMCIEGKRILDQMIDILENITNDLIKTQNQIKLSGICKNAIQRMFHMFRVSINVRNCYVKQPKISQLLPRWYVIWYGGKANFLKQLFCRHRDQREWYSGLFADEPNGPRTLHYIHWSCTHCGKLSRASHKPIK